MYHVTPFYNRGSILKQGLRLDKDLSGYRAIFLHGSAPAETSSSYDVWAVDTKGLFLEEDITGDNPDSWMCFDNIPKRKLQLSRGASNPSMIQSTVDEI